MVCIKPSDEFIILIITDPPSSENVQFTKDFIWDHLDEPTKSFMAKMASLSLQERQILYVSKIHASLEGSMKDGIIWEEKMCLSVQY